MVGATLDDGWHMVVAALVDGCLWLYSVATLVDGWHMVVAALVDCWHLVVATLVND